MYICIYVYMYIQIYIGIYICKYTHIYIYTYTHIWIYIYVYMYMYIYICMYTYTYIYIYTYICTHTHAHTYIPLKTCSGRFLQSLYLAERKCDEIHSKFRYFVLRTMSEHIDNINACKMKFTWSFDILCCTLILDM